MKIATIVPIPNLGLIEGDSYHMALAHLCKYVEYREFYREESQLGSFILLDNGVVETKVPMPMAEILHYGRDIKAHEVILPDVLYDREQTVTKGLIGIRIAKAEGWDGGLLAVPQGADAMGWVTCVRQMLDWEITAIGISRFTNKYFLDRLDALSQVPALLESKLEIHLLGCPGSPSEAYEIEKRFPGRIRGIDSGIAAIYTQKGLRMRDRESKPQVELDFRNVLPTSLLRENIDFWRSACQLPLQ